MKKTILALALALTCVVALAACGKKEEPTPAPAPETVSVPETKAEVKVMTHAEFDAAPVDSQVCVETYIQGNQSWWDGAARFYCQSEDGGYFLYDMACTEEECNTKLTKGTKIKVTGYKAEWSGEVEITDATWEIEDGNFIAEAEDVTQYLGTDDLAKHMNEFVAFKGLTIAPSTDANGAQAAYLYKYDGSGEPGDDLYFNVQDAKGTVYNFTVESYLCGKDTDVYKAIEGIQVGQTVDMEGFLYWYEGPNPHITSVVVK